MEFRYKINGKENFFSIDETDPKGLIYKGEERLIELIKNDGFDLERTIRRFLINHIAVSYAEYVNKKGDYVELGSINVKKLGEEKLDCGDKIPLTIIGLESESKEFRVVRTYHKSSLVRDIIEDIRDKYNLGKREEIMLFYPNRQLRISEDATVEDVVKKDPTWIKAGNIVSQVLVWIKNIL